MNRRSVVKVVSIITFITILTSVLVYNFMKVDNCRFHDSINITGSYQFRNGSREFENEIFHQEFTKQFDYIIVNGTKKTVDLHLRGCICAFKSCIRICEPFKQRQTGIENQPGQKQKSFNDIKIYNKYNESEVVDLINTHYHVLVGKPCRQSYLIGNGTEWWQFLSVSFIILQI